VVLLDVQMPDWGGIEATAHIRAKEQTTGGHVPVIAMTAHAMKGDREHCLAAGMDGYVAKPIQAQQLFDAIEGIESGKPAEAPSPVDATTAEHAPAESLDRAQLLDKFNGDAELLREIVEVFVQCSPQLLNDLQEAVARRDHETLKRVAHTIKSSVGYFSAKTAFESALLLETRGSKADWTDVEETFAVLEAAIERLRPALLLLVNGDAA
jgi:CheY-like chemotaxis protein